MSRIAKLTFPLAFSVLAATEDSSRAEAAEPPSLAARKETWQNELDNQKFYFPESYWGVMTSLRECTGDCEVHIIFDPKDKWVMVYRFVRGGREIVSLKGHTGPAFTTFGNVLYFADFSLDSTGCKVVAYDLTTGKRIWETKLSHAQPAGHSAYANHVLIRTSRKKEVENEAEGAAVIVTGRESYCDYVEVLDAKTGEMLALKNYRVGF